jgi:hypothetical protein
MRIRRSSLIALTLSLAGCGYIGEPLPPALEIPVQIADLTGKQRGGKIYLTFTPSLESTDKVLLKTLTAIELRAGENVAGEFDMDRWLASARAIAVDGAEAKATRVETSAAEWAGKQVVFAVRAIGPSGRGGRWSNLLVLNVAAAPQPPAELALRGRPQGLYLTWKGDGEQWRVWRKAEGDAEPALLGISGERIWLDQNVEFDKTYAYMAQQIVPGSATPAESEMSGMVSLKYEDRFAPAVPAGLTAIAGIRSVELNWDRNVEPDWKECQVYRAEGDGPLQKLGAPVASTSYSDTGAQSGKKYRYAVSALDQAGNESAQCAPLEIVAP